MLGVMMLHVVHQAISRSIGVTAELAPVSKGRGRGDLGLDTGHRQRPWLGLGVSSGGDGRGDGSTWKRAMFTAMVLEQRISCRVYFGTIRASIFNVHLESAPTMSVGRDGKVWKVMARVRTTEMHTHARRDDWHPAYRARRSSWIRDCGVVSCNKCVKRAADYLSFYYWEKGLDCIGVVRVEVTTYVVLAVNLGA